ncbi:MAG: hypothetical protein HWN68_09045 [Desulfobacterales bacterium]|nr:hypothetical protein [Desulfobacterales bacterium]
MVGKKLPQVIFRSFIRHNYAALQQLHNPSLSPLLQNKNCKINLLKTSSLMNEVLAHLLLYPNRQDTSSSGAKYT